MPSHALKEPFIRTSNCRTMLHSVLLIISFWITLKWGMSVCGALVSSSILSDIHHGIRISLPM